MLLIDRVTSDEVIERAYEWVCQRRKHYHHNSDVWQLRRWWDEKKPLIVAQLLSGSYRFREQRRVRAQGEVKEIWAAQDALVLKALAIVLHEELQPPISYFPSRISPIVSSAKLPLLVRIATSFFDLGSNDP